MPDLDRLSHNEGYRQGFDDGFVGRTRRWLFLGDASWSYSVGYSKGYNAGCATYEYSLTHYQDHGGEA